MLAILYYTVVKKARPSFTASLRGSTPGVQSPGLEGSKGVFYMTYTGCQSKSKEITLTERVCPNCGNIIELFSVDTEVACDKCGFVAYNDTLSCVQWCKYAKQCVGEEMYEAMMAIAKRQKEAG